MRNSKNTVMIHKITLAGILTALVVVLSFIRIPVLSVTTVKLILPVVVIGAALSGPILAGWLAFVSEMITFFSGEALMFIEWNAFGTFTTLLVKGVSYAFAAGFIYKFMAKKHPIGAVFCSAIAAPVVNTTVFLIGCRIFIWPNLIEMAGENGVGMGMLLFGMAGMNFIIELILNVILCPSILRIIEVATKKKRV